MLRPKISKPINIVEKGWGTEIWIHNDEQYCGKLLSFNEGSKFSMHYHMLKNETWYILKGNFTFRWIDTDTAEEIEQELVMGDCIYIPHGLPHQLEAHSEALIVEVSTQHFDYDSYRVRRGDSQK